MEGGREEGGERERAMTEWNGEEKRGMEAGEYTERRG